MKIAVFFVGGIIAVLLYRKSSVGGSGKNNWDDISKQGDCGTVPTF